MLCPMSSALWKRSVVVNPMELTLHKGQYYIVESAGYSLLDARHFSSAYNLARIASTGRIPT